MNEVLNRRKPFSHDQQLAFISKAWNLFRQEGTHDDISEYGAMLGGLMAAYCIRFDGDMEIAGIQYTSDETEEWFYDTINTEKAAKDFKEFAGAAIVAFDFTKAYNPF